MDFQFSVLYTYHGSEFLENKGPVLRSPGHESLIRTHGSSLYGYMILHKSSKYKYVSSAFKEIPSSSSELLIALLSVQRSQALVIYRSYNPIYVTSYFLYVTPGKLLHLSMTQTRSEVIMLLLSSYTSSGYASCYKGWCD